MSVIDWSADIYFLQISVNGTLMGTSQLLSVPYALHSKTAETTDYNNLTNKPDIPSDVSDLSDSTNLLFDGQWGSLSGTPPNISIFNNDAGYLTSEVDGSVTNEIQDLNLTGNTLTITNNSNATNIDLSSYLDNTDNQNLDNVLAIGNDAGGKQIKNIADPTDSQDVATKAYIDYKFNLIMSAMNGVIDYDGNHYDAVIIGNQIWMAENLKVTHYPDGTPIPNITDDSQWNGLSDNNTDDAYCYYNNNTNSEYGILYSYASAIADNWEHDNKDGQGVCPDGWHLPTKTEWEELIAYLGGDDVCGGKLKETGTSHWNSPNDGATNESGFTGLPGGYRPNDIGSFSDLGNYGFWWSATEYGGSQAWILYLCKDYAQDGRANYNKSTGISVRCIKDQ